MPKMKTAQEMAELIIALEDANEANNPLLYLDLGRETLNSLYKSLEKADEFFVDSTIWIILIDMLALHYLHRLQNGNETSPIPIPPMPLDSFMHAVAETLEMRLKETLCRGR